MFKHLAICLPFNFIARLISLLDVIIRLPLSLSSSENAQNVKEVEMSSVAKITAKYQITLPGEVRRALKAKVGDLLVFVQQTDDSYRVQAVPPRLTEALRLAGSRLSPVDFRQVHREFEEG
jgi:bifunctional DNA-binding transcriptional regulator/antitoxin component of YhaV-PrlF toxin-antitoxin module